MLGLEQQIERVADVAFDQTSAVVWRPPAEPDHTAEPGRGSHRWLLAVAAGVLTIGLVGGLVALVNTDRSGPLSPVNTGLTAPSSQPSDTAGVATDVSGPSTGSITPESTAIISDDQCTPQTTGRVRIENPTLFTRPSADPIPTQILSSYGTDPSRPYVVLERIFEGASQITDATSSTRINGAPANVFDSGNGLIALSFTLEDGSEGYLRTRGLTRDAVIAIAEAIEPRPLDAAVPGFDFLQNQLTGELAEIEIVAEAYGDLEGIASTLRCIVQSETGGELRLIGLTGPPVFQLALAMDQPPNIEILQRQGATIVVVPPLAPPDELLAAIRNASDEQWAAFLP